MIIKRCIPIEFFISNSVILLTFSYVLILFGILPKNETINTAWSIMVLSLAFCFYLIDRKAIKFYKLELLMIPLLCLITIVNMFFLSNLDSALYNLNTIFIIISFILLMSKSKYINPTTIEYVLNSIMLVGVASSIINILSNYSDMFNMYQVSSAYDIKFTGLFLGRNQQGVYLFLSLVSWHILKIIYRKQMSPFIPMLLLCNTILSFSRASILATMVYFLFYYLNKKNIKSILLMIPFAIALIFVYNYTSIGDFADRFLFRLEAGSAGRIERWSGVFTIIFDNLFLLLGVSSAGFKEVVSNIDVSQIDNAYIEVLLSYGLTGLFLYVFLILHNVQKTRMLVHNSQINKILFSFSSSFLIYSFFESVILFEPGIIQWTCSILLFAFPRAFYNNDLTLS